MVMLCVEVFCYTLLVMWLSSTANWWDVEALVYLYLLSVVSLGYKPIKSVLYDLLQRHQFNTQDGYKEWLEKAPTGGGSNLLSPFRILALYCSMLIDELL